MECSKWNGNYSNAWYLVGVTVSGSTATEYITNGNVFYGMEIGQNAYTYSSVSINGNYIGLVGDAAGSSYISYWEGIIIRALPPNGVMPSFSIQLIFNTYNFSKYINKLSI